MSNTVPESLIPFSTETATLKLDKKQLQPQWISKSFSQYKKPNHEKQALTSVRTACHAGHDIKITTTYKIEIDGKPIHFHADVDDEGRLHCHAMPYTAYGSAVDLVKSLLQQFPEALDETLSVQAHTGKKSRKSNSKSKGGNA